MADRNTRNLVPDKELKALVAQMGSGEARAMRDLEALLARYKDDARLHFLKGSLLAGQQDYAAARLSMRHAVDLAPDYAIARFQLGLLLLTGGDAYAAQETWGPLHSLPEDHYLHLFVKGLGHLIHDEFGETTRLLQDGIARNTENLPLNRDMQMVIDEVRRKLDAKGDGSQAASSVDLLLQQVALKSTRH